MECTQRLECTQELYDTRTERTCPEQIGFLGICGKKHPVVKGPNKIGRDPHTCSIILNLNSVSRQHAVINVLNNKEFMLMDLDSANKTKLLNKILQPYIPHPLRDGDTVQFGDIFGIFRLLEEDDTLPMTQAIDIPETPVAIKHVSKLHKAPTTLIPESPDVSDREDSFVVPSLRRSGKSISPFAKPINKTVTIQTLNTPQLDSNLNSAKQSTSLSFADDHNTSLNESFISLKPDKNIVDDIHEMDTQAPNPVNESTDSIYTADTQIPPELVPSPSIHNLNTQLPIHSLDTQLPANDHLPQVRKIHGQQEVQFDIYAANKENNKDIFNAETQPFTYNDNSTKNLNKNNSVQNRTLDCSSKADTKDKVNTSEEELLFDEVDGDCLEEDFNSQNILTDELPFKEDVVVQNKNPIPSIKDNRIDSDGSTDCEDIDMLPNAKKTAELPKENKQQAVVVEEFKSTSSKRTVRLKSDSSTDCEDIDNVPTQIIPEAAKDDLAKEKEKNNPHKRANRIQSGSSTDCEDFILTQKITEKKVDEDDDITDCDDDDVQEVINKANAPSLKPTEDDIATQVIEVEHYQTDKIPFEDMPTQVIDVDEVAAKSNNVVFEDQPTQIIDEIIPKNTAKFTKSFDDVKSPFKIPLQSPLKIKSKDIPKLTPSKLDDKPIEIEDNYYNCTQDIAADLGSQREQSPDILIVPNGDDDVVPCSVENYKVGEKFANIDKELSPVKKIDVRVTNFKNLSSQEVRDVIGVNANIKKLKRMPSDSSDVESTPTKAKKFIFTDSDLPNSQEIKTNMMSNTRSAVTESSSESETENCSEDQFTPFVHRKKKRKPATKMDLTKKFDIDKLPERVLTRQRKPPARFQDGDERPSPNILKRPFLPEQEDQIDGDIITENIKRLKTYEKEKSNKDARNNDSVKVEPKESILHKVTDNKKSEPKEKIKVKIEKPKRKDTKLKTDSSLRRSDASDKNKTQEDSLDSTSTSRTSSRTTRSKKKENESKKPEAKYELRANNKKDTDSKRKRTNKKQEKERSTSPEILVRRSKRKQESKENCDDAKVPKSILKKSIHEQSTVYNISSSSNDSPKNLKRSVVEERDAPSPKRTRSANVDPCGINNSSLRATPARVMKTQHVLFTAFPSAEVKQKLEKLGAVIVTDVMQCTVVLTMQIKRTFKLLCAVGLGRPIVGPSWVQACADTHMIVDPWLYLVKDESVERRFQFNLGQTLNGKRNFLKGFNVSSTPNVQPNASEMKLIVECSGGTWKEGGPNWMCVSCTKDKGLWPSLKKRGATIVSTEFILSGVLRQKVDINANKLE